MEVRFGTWNCRQRLDAKLDAVAELACDVLVVPECAKSVRLAHEPGVSFEWRGGYEPKGLGVFGFNGWTVDPLADIEPQPWCLPLAVSHVDSPRAISLLAVWTVKKSGDGRPSYTEQFADVLQGWGSLIATNP